MKSLQNIVILDLDGTIADCRHRLGFILGETKDWDRFFGTMEHDIFIPKVWESAKKKARDTQAIIAIVTGRPERYRQKTKQWLMEHGVYVEDECLLMREDGDRRTDTEVKKEIIKEVFIFSGFSVVAAFEDRPHIVEMLKDLKIPEVIECSYE